MIREAYRPEKALPTNTENRALLAEEAVLAGLLWDSSSEAWLKAKPNSKKEAQLAEEVDAASGRYLDAFRRAKRNLVGRCVECDEKGQFSGFDVEKGVGLYCAAHFPEPT